MFLAIGLIVGLLLGLTGAGGSVFAVPLLTLVAGLPAAEAMGLSLAAVSISAMTGSIGAIFRRQVVYTPILIMLPLSVAAAPLGRLTATQFSETTLLASFGVITLCIAVWMWRSASTTPDRARIVRSALDGESQQRSIACPLSPSGKFKLNAGCISVLAMSGLLVGFLSGLYGVGGGFLIVPLMLLVSQLSMLNAVASSLVIIAFTSTSGFAAYALTSPSLDTNLVWHIVAGSVGGMLISRFVASSIAGPRLQRVFAVVLSLIALTLLLEPLL